MDTGLETIISTAAQTNSCAHPIPNTLTTVCSSVNTSLTPLKEWSTQLRKLQPSYSLSESLMLIALHYKRRHHLPSLTSMVALRDSRSHTLTQQQRLLRQPLPLIARVTTMAALNQIPSTTSCKSTLLVKQSQLRYANSSTSIESEKTRSLGLPQICLLVIKNHLSLELCLQPRLIKVLSSAAKTNAWLISRAKTLLAKKANKSHFSKPDNLIS